MKVGAFAGTRVWGGRSAREAKLWRVFLHGGDVGAFVRTGGLLRHLGLLAFIPPCSWCLRERPHCGGGCLSDGDTENMEGGMKMRRSDESRLVRRNAGVGAGGALGRRNSGEFSYTGVMWVRLRGRGRGRGLVESWGRCFTFGVCCCLLGRWFFCGCLGGWWVCLGRCRLVF
jgi:hypothetical protein